MKQFYCANQFYYPNIPYYLHILATFDFLIV